MIRQAIESLYTDTCSVYEYQKVKNPQTKVTELKEVCVLENQPCRLSYGTIKETSDGILGGVTQIVKLFIAPEINVTVGSIIAVTRHGRTVNYTRSGEPAIYTNHQEIVLDLFKEYA